MPFGEALQQMPLYSKFLKDMLTRKNWYIYSDTIFVEGCCSAMIQRILPPKHKDSGSVTIPCSIGAVSVGKALIDLGASINLMPLSMCRKLGELDIMPTRMNLQLADHSITRPYRVIEGVLVRVKHFTFPANFVVMDIEEDAYIPLILGRPFMSTTSCAVDMGKKKLEMGIQDQKINIDLFDEEKQLLNQNVCLKVKEYEKKVRVKGHLIKFDADSLNTFLETPFVLELGETLPTYSRFCRFRPDPQDLAAQLCVPGRVFVLNAEGLPWKLLRKDLTTLA
ncbi:uncharacterized protein LOC114375331 [Glycine soja]|uniref:uncharacterized protein LOC114375331 n=1 Tax=Glycine soja TaxID=3848 RepID=UPI00103C8C3C|nr:uncharacterized protein LOC114375331 [Glycine soja]